MSDRLKAIIADCEQEIRDLVGILQLTNAERDALKKSVQALANIVMSEYPESDDRYKFAVKQLEKVK